MSAMVALNVNAPMRLTYAVLPGFVKRAHGTIINIGSVAALAPERLNGVYAGTKAFILAFSQSLRSELAGSGVRVQVVMPGATATDIWQTAGSSRDLVAALPMMPVDELVDAALNGLERSEFATLPSLHDDTLWNAFEAARLAMAGQLSASTRAPRYLGG
jgi:short-subunit dehydrogenase